MRSRSSPMQTALVSRRGEELIVNRPSGFLNASISRTGYAGPESPAESELGIIWRAYHLLFS
jgi:hypothetical protein